MTRKDLFRIIASFPRYFGLKGFPGDTFQISEIDSYISDDAPILCLQVDRDGKWLSHAKGSPEEVRAQIS